ncbi:hypothetical protein [Cohnella panacarvi]|uniref:hypothetical protein n=1 Tax=Cohnella panacarvi TaxID=400776 RepID=UPI0012EB2489|nr:hypothetical protein [Cohnella panacarvi]
MIDSLSYCSLRLDYLDGQGNRPFPDNGSSYGVIRFRTSRVEEIEIPYGERMGGTNYDGNPCTQNGFTGARNEEIIPEWKLDGRINPIDGAELYKVSDDKERLVGIYDARKGKFIEAKEK